MPENTAAQSLDLLLSAAHDALWAWDIDGNRAVWGAAWRTITGQGNDARLKPGIEEWQDRLHPDERSQVLHTLEQYLAGNTARFESEHRLLHEDGGYRWIAASAICARDASGKALRMAGSFTDITEHKVLEPYTRLPNRILFLDRLERSLSRLRFGGNHAVGVLSVHLQLPASHADQLTHDEQAQLGRILSERITAELRPWDFVAQFNVLEFAVLLEMVASGTDLPTITDRLFKALHRPIQVGQHSLQISAAIGSADTATVSGNEERLLRAAESAAQLAATHGDFRHVSFDPATQEQLAHRLALERDIVATLMERGFEPWFQPIVRLSDGAITGFEALARWPRDGETLPPKQFLSFLEHSGLVSQLSWIMLEKGLTSLAAWHQQGLLRSDCRLNVNLSADQLLEPHLAGSALALLEDLALSPSLLNLELPEKAVLRQNDKALRAVNLLREQGVGIVIDDTGTGMSSLPQLQAFPLDALKIDRAFVQRLESDEAACNMARSVIALASALDLTAIAEGVETPAQLAFLQDNGVHAAQGFLFGKPMPAETVPQWLESSKPLIVDLLTPAL
ncbi:putative bifunctional diguanylate cyclase/phosphodiesterase [Formivibrio citricus]|nr:GGDEF domain-containing phosphodiesterase [Formivibrio citricus]